MTCWDGQCPEGGYDACTAWTAPCWAPECWEQGCNGYRDCLDACTDDDCVYECRYGPSIPGLGQCEILTQAACDGIDGSVFHSGKECGQIDCP